MNLSLPLFDPITPDDRAPPLSRAGAAAALTPGAAAADDGAAGAAAAAVAPGLAAGAADPPSVAPWAPVFDLTQYPAVWRASQIGGVARPVTTSGFAALDAQLPGGGWPHGVLSELLLPEPGVGELRLLAPALAAVTAGAVAAARSGGAAGSAGSAAQHDDRCVMLFDPPVLLNAWALVQCGLASRHWLVVQGRAGQGRAGPAGAIAPGAPRGANRLAPLLPSADLLWALEQSLKSGHVGAVLAWLPLNLRADALRRLQLAAQSHDGPVFLFRDALARSQPSPAPLRLLLQPAGIDVLSVRLLKRRGPALAQPLRLALPPVLAPHQQAQAEARQRALWPASRSGPLPGQPPGPLSASLPAPLSAPLSAPPGLPARPHRSP